jgi:hypothetical protein
MLNNFGGGKCCLFSDAASCHRPIPRDLQNLTIFKLTFPTSPVTVSVSGWIYILCILCSYFKIKWVYMSGSLIWTWMQCMFKMSNGIGLHKWMNGYWRHDNGLFMVFHWSRAGFTCEWHYWQYHWLSNIPFIHRPTSHSCTTPAFLDQPDLCKRFYAFFAGEYINTFIV